jgi:acetyl esterase/lipase
MDKLGDELRQKNIEAVVGNHTLSGLYASEAIADCKSGKISSIAIVGHSLGASAAVSMAEQLAQAGVRVALIVTIDPVVETRVSRNVQTLKNFYFSNGVGRAVQRAPDFRGSLQNVDMKADSQLGHVSLANSETLHRQIFGYVSAAAGSRCR